MISNISDFSLDNIWIFFKHELLFSFDIEHKGVLSWPQFIGEMGCSPNWDNSRHNRSVDSNLEKKLYII